MTYADLIEDPGDLLISEWQRQPVVDALVNALLDVARRYIDEPLRQLERMEDLKTAEGVWLDWIGDRSGYARPQVASTSERFGLDGSDGVGFDQGPFATVDPLGNTDPVPDAQYRRLLEAHSRSLVGAGRMSDVAASASALYGSVSVTDGSGAASVAIAVSDPVTEFDGDMIAAELPAVLGLPAGVEPTITIS